MKGFLPNSNEKWTLHTSKQTSSAVQFRQFFATVLQNETLTARTQRILAQSHTHTHAAHKLHSASLNGIAARNHETHQSVRLHPKMFLASFSTMSETAAFPWFWQPQTCPTSPLSTKPAKASHYRNLEANQMKQRNQLSNTHFSIKFLSITSRTFTHTHMTHTYLIYTYIYIYYKY